MAHSGSLTRQPSALTRRTGCVPGGQRVCFQPLLPALDGPRQADGPTLVQPRWQLLWGGEREAGSMPPSPAEPSGCFDSFHHMVSQNPKEIWGWGPAESKQPWGFSAEGRGVLLLCLESPLLSLRKLQGHLPI